MSSFIGHSLTAIGIGIACKSPTQSLVQRLTWLCWLVIIALFPDLDHFIPGLHQSAHSQIRITHSFTFSLLMPVCTIFLIRILRFSKKRLKTYSLQVILAGISHIVLDLLVGVTALPLFYPLSKQSFKLPWGILPSAGKLSLNNYYLYHNLFIEMGVIIPLFSIVVILRYAHLDNLILKQYISILLFISFCFMTWAFNLSR